MFIARLNALSLFPSYIRAIPYSYRCIYSFPCGCHFEQLNKAELKLILGIHHELIRLYAPREETGRRGSKGGEKGIPPETGPLPREPAGPPSDEMLCCVRHRAIRRGVSDGGSFPGGSAIRTVPALPGGGRVLRRRFAFSGTPAGNQKDRKDTAACCAAATGAGSPTGCSAAESTGRAAVCAATETGSPAAGGSAGCIIKHGNWRQENSAASKIAWVGGQYGRFGQRACRGV